MASSDHPEPAYPGGVIDLRLHQARERLGLVEQALETVRAGEDLLLVFHEPPARLAGHIETRYPGRFEVRPVTEGPEVWTLRVHPRGD